MEPCGGIDGGDGGGELGCPGEEIGPVGGGVGVEDVVDGGGGFLGGGDLEGGGLGDLQDCGCGEVYGEPA